MQWTCPSGIRLGRTSRTISLL